MGKKLSLVIPAKDANDPKLAELLKSIEAQDFPKEDMEVLVITEGTSESAKAIGIRKAQGEVIGILASDNELMEPDDLSSLYHSAEVYGAAYPAYYAYVKNDDVLNRYFALFGGNDPLSFYMGKNDKSSVISYMPLNNYATFGDNGYFVRKNLIEKTDLDNYYHIDNANEIPSGLTKKDFTRSIWHKTGGNIIHFFKKRYRYGMQYAFDSKRRWHLVDFHQPKDIMRLLWFIFATLTVIQPLSLSVRGYLKVKDVAWFLHPIVCIGTLFTYALLTVNLGIKRVFQSLSVPLTVRRA